MCSKANYFSNNNTPFYEPRDLETDSQWDVTSPHKLVRQTNEWIFYFGKYPEECAFITSEKEVINLIGETGIALTRHVLKIPVENALQGSIQAAKQYVCEKIKRIKKQITIFADKNELTWTSTSGRIKLDYKNSYINLDFFVCDDTGDFHMLIGKPSRWMGEITYTEMRSLNNLIYVLRTMDHAFHESLEFELPIDSWHSLRELTFEPTYQYLPEKICEVCAVYGGICENCRESKFYLDISK